MQLKRKSNFKWTIGKRLLLAFALMIIGLFANGGFNYIKMGTINNSLNSITEGEIPSIELAHSIRYNHSQEYSLILEYLTVVRSRNTPKMNEYREAYVEQKDKLVTRYEEYSGYLETEEERAIYEELVLRRDNLWKVTDSVIESSNMTNTKLFEISMQLERSMNNIEGTVDKLLRLNQDSIKEAKISTDTTFKSTRLQNLLFIGITALLSVIGALFIARSITKPLRIATKAIQALSDGDLSQQEIKYKRKDEIGDIIAALNETVSTLRDTMAQVHDSSMQVASSSEELYASAEQSTKASEQVTLITQESAEGAERQLQSVNEVSSSMEQMSAGIQQIAKNSEEMEQVSQSASTTTEQGTVKVEEVVSQMREISVSVSETALLIKALDQKTDQIENIVGLITDIADQTNLLALNAAIEAARAGEGGKGFAVVAAEVRKLAEESRVSASQISHTIQEIQIDTSKAVDSMTDNMDKVEDGITYVDEVKTSFDSISGAMTDVSKKVHEVVAAVQQIASVSEHIVTAVDGVKEIAESSARASQESSAATEEQLATMEEVSASSQSLSKLADNLQGLMAKFKM
ncbi:methyl-accepting chemotaxis protein [Bacillus sp. HMF5848]|nr:HAMP domain-containing methyl-accepting chemotaxis protein [Bacillus sp. HMF5848]RSK25899.1 methyl-accepting chemotaxis protein [Bacillus sp. HMF5848]